MRRGILLAAALVALGAACNKSESPTIAVPTGSPAASPAATPVSVSITSPADGAEVGGNVVTVEVEAKGIEVKAADGDRSGKTGHYHVFVDPATPPAADGQVIPTNDKIIHTNQPTATVEGLEPGTHTLWVVFADGKHIPLNPLVATKLTVVVQQ
jgi:hypothetical protein